MAEAYIMLHTYRIDVDADDPTICGDDCEGLQSTDDMCQIWDIILKSVDTVCPPCNQDTNEHSLPKFYRCEDCINCEVDVIE